MPKSEFFNRVIYGLLAAMVGLFVVWQGGYIFFAAVMLISLLISIEFDNLRKDGRICFMFIAFPMLFSYHPEVALALVLATIVLISIFDIILKTNHSWLIISIIYIAVPAISIIWLSVQGNGINLVLWLLLVISATDIGAYFAGKKFGKRLLAPKISPKKTWEGLIGGIITAMVVSTVYPSKMTFVLLSIVFAITGQLSDLLESSIKRYYGVKDTGKILPGHGGAMDRLDALVLTAPLAAIFNYYRILQW